MDGLWTSREAARRRYLDAVAYLALLKHRFHVYHIGYMDENDLDTDVEEGKYNARFHGM